MVREDDLWLIPLRGPPRSGGLLLKQRNPPAGDRSLLVREVLADRPPVTGDRKAFWTMHSKRCGFRWGGRRGDPHV